MADESWQQIGKTFDDALRQKPEHRIDLVRRACGKNKTLLTEIESLLSSFDSAENFMETPAVAKVADIIEDETKKSNPRKVFRPLRCHRADRRGRYG